MTRSNNIIKWLLKPLTHFLSQKCFNEVGLLTSKQRLQIVIYVFRRRGLQLGLQGIEKRGGPSDAYITDFS